VSSPHAGEVYPPGAERPASRNLREYLEATPAHGSTTDAVTDALREAILDGALPPSTWLREDELATQLRVSRTPVREALRRLTDEHLTVRETHRGTVVAPMTLDDILAVYAVRETLEGLAARMAARRRPPGTVEALASVHSRMLEAAERSDALALSQLNLEFHRILRESSGNPYLDRFLTQVEHAVRRFGRSTYDTPGRTEAALAEHSAIIGAVASGDADLAAKHATEHMQHARNVRIQSALNS
jgi:DNA-binding GntR family transcriptional regulator